MRKIARLIVVLAGLVVSVRCSSGHHHTVVSAEHARQGNEHREARR
jgi:hypothetical protein